MVDGGADLTGFLEAAGRALADAQESLTGKALDAPRAVAISDAELEVKATMQRAAGGVLALQPVSSADALKGGIDPGLLSAVRIRYVAVTEEAIAPPAASPVKTEEIVIAWLQERADVAALDKILGGLTFEAVFIPERRRWLVTAKDPRDRLVREVVVPDEKG